MVVVWAVVAEHTHTHQPTSAAVLVLFVVYGCTSVQTFP